MKNLLPLLIILLINSSVLHAQKKVFIRVYDLSGNKIAKGFLAGTTDSSVLIFKDSAKIPIAVSGIGYIKTKRTAGHTILVSSITGTVLFGIIGAFSGEPDKNDGTTVGSLHDALNVTPGEGLAAGALLGAGMGAAIGSIIHLTGRHHTFYIYGNPKNFKQQKQKIDSLTQ